MKRMMVVCVLGCIGCGGGEETPAQKCEVLVNDVCDRGVECIPQAGTHAACVQALDQVLTCGTAKQVSMTYDRCIQQLKADSCQTLFPTDPQTGQVTLVLPTDCMGVILKLEPDRPTPVTPAIGSSPFQHASQLSTVSAD